MQVYMDFQIVAIYVYMKKVMTIELKNVLLVEL